MCHVSRSRWDILISNSWSAEGFPGENSGVISLSIARGIFGGIFGRVITGGIPGKVPGSIPEKKYLLKALEEILKHFL